MKPSPEETTGAADIPSSVGPNLWLFEGLEETFDNGGDLICFSHLRWNFVYQRPQHLMSRCARECRVFFVEEPVFTSGLAPHLVSRVEESGVCVVVPQIPDSTKPEDVQQIMRQLIDEMCAQCGIRDSILWYYTPMARGHSRHLSARAIVFDCMDELSLFKGAPASIKAAEEELFSIADVVFTGGMSLYEAKQHLHKNIHAMPSSIDAEHFRKARTPGLEPVQLRPIPHPRIGYSGVIDERMDLDLLAQLAASNPGWNFIMVGPVVKIDPSGLPSRRNIHYLGMQPYSELPWYMAGLDVAMLPFAKNESTRYISPTKTPEYLAAGLPVVSTSIKDVVRPYGDQGLVRIADTAEEFSAAIADALTHQPRNAAASLAKIDEFLKHTSWDRTWINMMKLVDRSIAKREVTAKSQVGSR